jgi:plasmid stability protein
MTLRIDPDLLAALRLRARREGRSVSAEVVRMIRKEVEPASPRRRKPMLTMGMFADFEAPDLEEFKRLRRQLSVAFWRRVRGGRRSA